MPNTEKHFLSHVALGKQGVITAFSSLENFFNIHSYFYTLEAAVGGVSSVPERPARLLPMIQ